MFGNAWLWFLFRLALVPLLLLSVLTAAAGLIGQSIPAEQVAFMTDANDGQWDIYVLDIGRNLLDRVTWSSADERFPAYSPDGERLVYHSNARMKARSASTTYTNNIYFYELYVSDADGRNPQLVSGAFMPLPPVDDYRQAGAAVGAFSPDGRSVVFHTTAFSDASFSDWALVLLNLDNAAKPRIIADAPGSDVFGDFSPDGKRIVFASERNSTSGSMDIYVADLDTGVLHQITNVQRLVELDTQRAGSIIVDGYPTWSPDGTRILFHSTRSGYGGNSIYVMDADGSRVRRLSSVTSDDQQPVWSADGTRIVFASDRNNNFNHQIYMMNADGSSVRQLTWLPGSALTPAWRP